MKIKIPYNLDGVSIAQYQKAMKHEEPLRKVSALCGISYEDLLTYPKELTLEAEKLTEKVLNTETTKHVKVFEIKGKKVGFITDWSKLTTGEYVDLESYCKDVVANAHKIMAVLYRPVSNELGNKYKIAPYKDKLHENEFLEVPVARFVSALVFFWNTRNNYLTASLLSLAKLNPTNLVKGGAGMIPFTGWLMKILQRLKK
tara:strand:+ start:3405 stop:4007 length:603 start_codon:yes stop_codon:yes gene_type:complete